MSLEYTPIEEIPVYVSDLAKVFRSGKMNSIQFRLNQLRNLYFALEDNLQVFCDALEEDFHRSPFETKLFEHYIIKGELIDIMKNLSKWLKPHKPYAIPIAHATANIKIEKIARGVVLIITPFNYPLMLGLSPLFGAIAGGNCVVFKSSEMVPNFSRELTRVLQSVFDEDIIRVVNGSVKETSVLLEQKFDLIFFTGSPKVGKIVAKAASDHLTPVVLELGGKSPAIVTKDHGNLTTLLDRILWGKYLNSGQTCVAVDYILCDEEIKFELIAKLKERLPVALPNLSKDSDYTHIINDASFQGLKSIIETTKGEIITGGLSELDLESRFFPPTIITEVSWDDSTMQRENFGPILPILSYKDLNQALDNVVRDHDCPLALYIYSQNKKEIDLIKSRVRSGGLVINDNINHVGVGTVPFGGIGGSGYGNYHGKYSIDTFTHERVIYQQPFYAELLMKMRYPPFTSLKEKLFVAALDSKAYFGRKGNVPIRPRSFLHHLAGLLTLLGLLFIVLRYFKK